MNSNVPLQPGPPACPNLLLRGGLSTKASGWAGAGGAGQGWEGHDPRRGSLESFLGCPSNKTNDRGPELQSQLAAQLNLGGIRVDTGMVTVCGGSK